MFDTSNFYNLANPGLNADIGDMQFNSMFPGTQFMDYDSYIPGITGTMNGIDITRQPYQDTFQSQQEEKRRQRSGFSFISKALFGMIAVATVALTLKGIKNGTLNLWGKIKGLFKKNTD